jgi:excisionase family DNA binding protein
MNNVVPIKPDHEPLLTKQQLAAHFRVSPRMIEQWVAKRGLPYVIVGSRKRFRLSDVLRFWGN